MEGVADGWVGSAGYGVDGVCERATCKKKEGRECESGLARWKGEVMAEGAMRALVA